MSQTSTISSPIPKATVVALLVIAGHVGAFLALEQMKPIDIKPIKKDPIQVHFVKIVEPPKPKIEPPKPKVEPKKEIKEVKITKQTPPPPKKEEKIQPVKKSPAPKQVKQVEKPQPKPDPQPIVQKTEPKIVEQVRPVQEKPVQQPAPAPAPAPAPVDHTPKTVSIGGAGIQWSRSPSLSYDASDLQGSPRSVTVLIEANEKGKVTNVQIVKSSGISALDEKVLRAVRGAKFKPYKENGVAYPIRAQQPFALT